MPCGVAVMYLRADRVVHGSLGPPTDAAAETTEPGALDGARLPVAGVAFVVKKGVPRRAQNQLELPIGRTWCSRERRDEPLKFVFCLVRKCAAARRADGPGRFFNTPPSFFFSSPEIPWMRPSGSESAEHGPATFCAAAI